MFRRLIVGCLGLALLITGCGGDDDAQADAPAPATAAATATAEPGCSTADGEQAYDLLTEFATEWDDAMALADSTPRMQLAERIDALQRIRRDVANQDWPDCAGAAQTALVAAMDDAIKGYINFLGDGSDTVTQRHFDDYAESLDVFADEMDAIS